MAHFIFDEYAALLMSGTGVDWVNDTIIASLYSDLVTPLPEHDYTDLSAAMDGVQTLANKSVDATGIAVSDGVIFPAVSFPDPEILSGMFIYRDNGASSYTMMVNLDQGEDSFDGLEMFDISMAGTTVTVVPNGTNNGWFRP